MNFKFGVLYAKAGQKTDNEMFSNGKKIIVYYYHIVLVILQYMCRGTATCNSCNLLQKKGVRDFRSLSSC